MFSLCGCANSEGKVDTEQKIVENDDVITMNVKSGDEYSTRIEDTDDGKLYSIVSKDFYVDLVIGDNYFDTQLSDIYKNFNAYNGKTVEIEGFVKNNGKYTFVSRYSENSICTDCPPGYAFFEYEWHGDEELEFGEETTWIKVKGELKSGNDGMEYYYIDAYSIEVMDEWGMATVVN